MASLAFVATCGICEKPFATTRKSAKYCGDKCRKQASRSGRSTGAGRLDPPEPPARLTYAERFVAAVLQRLTDASRADEPLSLLALSLAEDSVNERLPPAARKAFTAEFRATFAEAMRGVAADSRVDELRRRRDELRRGAG